MPKSFTFVTNTTAKNQHNKVHNLMYFVVFMTENDNYPVFLQLSIQIAAITA
ncbi:protein of unknown function [Moritella yayanosii]|uniref:Uncharacterized protein n=1 Tax=Moritella yayanosii TaxID=69539 RepID=A0A330LSK4_9GAMM|nr:protein of unknown function [Moritella yayanosii]